jgi:hypothetical protein
MIAMHLDTNPETSSRPPPTAIPIRITRRWPRAPRWCLTRRASSGSPSSAASVKEVLGNPACRVRPVAEPVPAAIVGSPAGEVFGHLVRMNEGLRHDAPKLALQRFLAAVDLDRVQARTEAWLCKVAGEGALRAAALVALGV